MSKAPREGFSSGADNRSQMYFIPESNNRSTNSGSFLNHGDVDMSPSRSSSPLPNCLEYPNSTRYWVEYKHHKSNVAAQTDEDVPPHVVFTDIPEVVPHQSSPQQEVKSTPLYDTPRPTIMQFSDEQKRVLELVQSHQNVFFTGPAGTGKSLLLRKIIQRLRLTKEVAVTAPTGVAGVNIGGSTIHSFAGIGLGKESADKLAEKIAWSSHLRKRWKSTEVLIIDEISMMDAILFDKLEYIARAVRGCQLPFGGIQLVLSGDFFQLPPVPDQSHEYRMPATYAFDAKSWSKCISRPVFLSQVFRQKDNTFVEILSSMRTGVLEIKHIKQLQYLSRPLHYDDGIEASYLYVENHNNSRLAALPSYEHTYDSMDSAGYDYRGHPIPEESAELLLDRLVAVPAISLKINAQVMLIQNIEQGVLVNGSMGKVVEFLTTGEALARQIRIATIKANPPPGQSKIMEPRPLNNGAFGPREKWPLVHFPNGCELLCAPMEFTVEGFMGNVEARRFQVPLILGWALSIHKSQGQTLARVSVDLGRIFERGQAYVALSRATTMEHLELTNFQPSKVMAHPRVIQWQEFWTSYDHNASFDEMDSEEAISRFWDDSEVTSLGF